MYRMSYPFSSATLNSVSSGISNDEYLFDPHHGHLNDIDSTIMHLLSAMTEASSHHLLCDHPNAFQQAAPRSQINPSIHFDSDMCIRLQVC